jgi:MoaA/NifB/PqqE/SkfB family radical SAM enzyme
VKAVGPLVAFHVTDRCQLNCQHCLRDPDSRPRDIDVKVVGKVLDEAKAAFGATKMSMTGGEPTLHPRFVELVDVAVACGFQWQMVSNGRRFVDLLGELQSAPARVASIRTIFFSLDGADRATHDHVRGAGSFDDVMDATAACVAADVPFTLQMVVHRKNVHQLDAMALLAARLGASQASFAMLQPTGTFLDAELALSPQAWRHAQAHVDDLKELLRMPVVRPEGWSHHGGPVPVCGAWSQDILHVELDGHLTVCCQLAGQPTATGGPSDVGPSLSSSSLVDARAALRPTIDDARAAVTAQASSASPWASFSCNACAAHFGKASWADGAVGAVAGPRAARARWKGAWAEGHVRAKAGLPVVP